jgi:hypothetical protein
MDHAQLMEREAKRLEQRRRGAWLLYVSIYAALHDPASPFWTLARAK